MPNTSRDPLITLLTDFGTTDHYAGVLKGVIAGICPEARVVDISHEVTPYQIREGAYLLAQAWPWFPEGSIHVAVVDPGVGSERRPLAVEADGYRFVLPDNGILSGLNVRSPVVREIRNERCMLYPVSHTFHGRDIFAPTAAQLARGLAFEDIGPVVSDWIRFPATGPTVLHVDRFGNVVTALRAQDWHLGTRTGWALRVGSGCVRRFGKNYFGTNYFGTNYAQTDAGELFVVEGSSGYLEISVREASAAAILGCRAGDPVTLQVE